MILLNRFSRELAGLFVDDGWLAIFVLGVVAAAAIASLLSGLWGGCVLLGGSLCALSVNVIGTVRSSRRPWAPAGQDEPGNLGPRHLPGIDGRQ